jgi:hypothetical protein
VGNLTTGDGEKRMTVEEIRAWLSENKEKAEVVAFITEITPKTQIGAETVAPYLETDDGRKLIQPLIDSAVSKGVKSFKEGHYEKDLKAAVAAEILKINPQETPEQKQIRELRETVEKSEGARARDNLRRQIVEEAAKLGVPAWWVDDFSGNTIEEAKVFMGKVKNFVSDIETKKANELLVGGAKPGSGNGQGTKTDASKLTLEEAIALEEGGKLNEALH